MGEPSSATDTVQPDKVTIDGHHFEFNHPEQSQDHIDALDALVDSEDAKYEDIDAELKKWEVAVIPSGDR